MAKVFRKLNSEIHSLIKSNRQRRSNRKAYRILSRLDKHYLTDIGLIQEDLHLLSSGELPGRFRQVNPEKNGAADVRLVSSGPAVAALEEESGVYPDCLDKAA